LAELLYSRDHAPEALGEVDRVTSPEALEDPSIRYLRARILESLGRDADAALLVADPKDVVASFGPWWAVRGRLAHARGDENLAGSSFFEALAADPLDAEVACEGIAAASTPKNPLQIPLCDAARARREPDIGQE
jgi:Flp pilus assembly protein TadD